MNEPNEKPEKSPRELERERELDRIVTNVFKIHDLIVNRYYTKTLAKNKLSGDM
jgi:hypothetical protein